MTRPTDLELMRYFDGELVDEAVAKYVAESNEAARKLRGLEVAAEIVASRAAKATGGDGIADAVMAAIAKDASAAPSDLELMMYFDGELGPDRGEVVAAHLAASAPAAAKIRGLELGGEIVARHASHTSVAADRVADAVMAVIAEEAARQDELGVAARSKSAPPATRAAVAARAPAANDNAKRIYAAALLAVAAAAALLVWGRSAPDTGVATIPTSSAEVLPSVVAAAPPPVAPTPSASPSAEDDSEPEAVHGVEVAAVEFGGRMGSIFYVPSGTEGSGTTTTVVWLADDGGDE